MTEFSLLAWLDGASAWWWIAFAVALGAAEMATGTYVLLWLAAAAFGTGAALGLISDLSGMAQLAIFAVLSILFIAAGKVWAVRNPPEPAEGPALNMRAQQLVGRTGKAMAAFENGEGQIEIDGVRWRARLAGGKTATSDAADPLTVVEAEGMTLICERS